MELLSGAALAVIIKGIQGIIAAAPTIKAVSVKAKEMIANLFSKGLITKETQNKLWANVDATCKAAKAGKLGPEWEVEPD